MQGSVVQDDEEPDDGAFPLHYTEDSVKNRNVPSRAALSIIRPTIGRSDTVVDRGRTAMQGYQNLFLVNLDVVNSKEVCKFREVYRLSFAREYGSKMKEGYVTVKHLRKVPGSDVGRSCLLSHCLGCFETSWTKVWAVLKPGFLALLEDPFSGKLLDIMVLDSSRFQDAKECSEQPHLAEQVAPREDSCCRLPSLFHRKVRSLFWPLRYSGTQDRRLPSLYMARKGPFNPRESEPNSWEETMIDELDRRKYPRMPWHEVHCALWGPPCPDVCK